MKGTTGSPELGSVIVGVDGSESAHRAALWAAAAAARRDSPLHIVHAADTGGRTLYLSAESVERARADRIRDEFPALTVQAHAEKSLTVAGVLVEASRHADLLVMGGRRSPGCIGPALGRATHSLLHHAHCPVQLIPRQGSGGSES
ncbi:universal stress protein [Streptomyces sp. NPDC001832]|uniref:universal stress protein n=1 Tax=Streptomyces sp. NPDC001832 TaxID=3154527 RepID=UPI003331D007